NSGVVGDAGSDIVALSASVGVITNNGDGTWSWSYDTSDGPEQSQTVMITATDSDGAIKAAAFGLTVTNGGPTGSVNEAEVTVVEGAIATNSGTYGDPGDDTVTLTASIGTVTDNGDGTWSWSFNSVDGPDESQTVTITITDSDDAIQIISFN